MGKLKITCKFGVIPNELLNRSDVSLKAKGLFAFIQSKPDGWSFSAEKIMKQTKDGRDGVKVGLKELETMGYLKRFLKKQEEGKWKGYEYVLVDKPSTENPSTDIPSTEKPSTYSKQDNSKQEYSKKDNSMQSNDCDPKEVSEILNIFKKINPFTNFGNKTQRSACNEMLKKYGFEELSKIAELAVNIQNKKFAPVITSPYQLKIKFGELASFIKKEQDNPIAVEIL